MKKNGFTLLEMMIVITILALIAVVGSGSFFSILRGSTKTKNLSLVKQNGDYALSVMERMIRNARSLKAPTTSGPTDSILIVNPDGGETLFKCDSTTDPPTISSGSASLISNEVKVSSDCNTFFNVVLGRKELESTRIDISFTLVPNKEIERPEEKAEINFKTSVTMRNY
ncbi:MAG: PulJ/GspJ family protein [Microgenomates group bacterium]